MSSKGRDIDQRTREEDRIPGRDANRDPISGAPGAHPVGVGAGAAAGGAAGAAIGSVGGPVGAVAGAAIGAIAGGLAGKGAAEAVNPTDEDAFWADNYRNRPYSKGARYDEYQPAYQYGWESFAFYLPSGKTWDEVEPELGRSWNARRGKSTLSWDRAREGTRDAWERLVARTPRSEVSSEDGETAHVLTHLRRTCEDGAKGFRHAAEVLKDTEYAALLNKLADERARLASELKGEILHHGGKLDDSGTTAGAAHRAWIDLKGAVAGSPHSVLAECERGEDHAKHAYEEALKNNKLPEHVLGLIRRQYQSVKDSHDRVRTLRDATQ
jgi:uncharacterized protein (TIGR02284 family)